MDWTSFLFGASVGVCVSLLALIGGALIFARKKVNL